MSSRSAVVKLSDLSIIVQLCCQQIQCYIPVHLPSTETVIAGLETSVGVQQKDACSSNSVHHGHVRRPKSFAIVSDSSSAYNVDKVSNVMKSGMTHVQICIKSSNNMK